MDALDELKSMLAPAGGGIHVVSTGVEEMRALQRTIYGAETDYAIEGLWHSALMSLEGASIVLLGVPSDTGAGFVRGANFGPAEVRRTAHGDREHPVHGPGVVDVGDVRVVPHFLSEEMLSEQQIAESRDALYGDRASALPVTPLAMCRRALDDLRALNPEVVPIVIGGDHSVGWPAFASAEAHARAQGKRVGLVHVDAHTDLLATRLGVRYCFATWAYHANELLGRDGRLVQLGIRASGHDREHWESTLGVRQYWPSEVAERSTESIIDEIIERFEKLDVDCIYVSNDIDGTDIAFAAATGTPEANGLSPDFVSGVTSALCKRFPLIGGDLVEVAPPLAGNRDGEPARTLATASRYLGDLVAGARR